jgi:hypothetical protein
MICGILQLNLIECKLMQFVTRLNVKNGRKKRNYLIHSSVFSGGLRSDHKYSSPWTVTTFYRHTRFLSIMVIVKNWRFMRREKLWIQVTISMHKNHNNTHSLDNYNNIIPHQRVLCEEDSLPARKKDPQGKTEREIFSFLRFAL